MKNYFRTLIVLLTALGIQSCKKNADTPPPVTPPANSQYLYIGGQQSGSSSAANGIYYKIRLDSLSSITDLTKSADSPHLLPNASTILSMQSSGNSMYMTASNAKGYWKDDSFVPVDDASAIQYLAADASGNVYTAGTSVKTGGMAYWKNNQETALISKVDFSKYPHLQYQAAAITGIALQNDHVLVSGGYTLYDATMQTSKSITGLYQVLWNDGSEQVLLHNGVQNLINSTGIATAGSDVYISAMIPPAPGGKSNDGGYWKNGNWNSVNDGQFTSSGICTSGQDLYLIGETRSGSSFNITMQPVYLKNGAINTPDHGIGHIFSIIANGTDSYILGFDDTNHYAIWKNGKMIATLATNQQMFLYCLAVGK